MPRNALLRDSHALGFRECGLPCVLSDLVVAGLARIAKRQKGAKLYLPSRVNLSRLLEIDGLVAALIVKPRTPYLVRALVITRTEAD
jgi:hypothetical protein